MSIDNSNLITDFQKESQTTKLNLKENEIEKELNNFISKDNYKYKVGNWLRDIMPISSPRSFIEKYYNENNPFALDEWTSNWGIDTYKCFSSLWIKTNDTLKNSKNEEEKWDYMDMRKRQNSDWAHEIIYKGVSLAKSNEYEKAIKVYNHAIDIDPNCVDAYVAKGAANFEKALQIDPNCTNAKKYLKATQNRKAEEDKIKEMEQKKQEEEERIKRENQSKNDIILDNSKLITSPLFMDMITVSPSRSDMKKSKKKKKKSHHRSRSHSRSRKKHKRHHSSKNKNHRHSTSSKKKHHSRRHSSKYSYSSDSSISTSYSSSDDYSTDFSSSNSYSESDYKKEKRSSHYYNDSDDYSDDSKKRSQSHHHKSHNKRRRKDEDNEK